MWKALVTGLAAASAALALAAASSAGGLPSPASLPAGWTQVSINVMLNRAPHTVTLNRGRIQSGTASSLTLREADGSVVTVPVSAATRFVVNGQPAAITDLRPGAFAITWQIDGASAQRVQAQVRPQIVRPGRVSKR